MYTPGRVAEEMRFDRLSFVLSVLSLAYVRCHLSKPMDGVSHIRLGTGQPPSCSQISGHRSLVVVDGQVMSLTLWCAPFARPVRDYP